jgi:hypothetical protein
MFALSQLRVLNVTAASVLSAIVLANTPVAAGGPAAKLRPVGPYEPIIASVGVRRVVASFAPEFGHCTVNASVWDSIEAQSDSAVRIRVSLSPGQMIHFDSLETETKSLHLQCGDDAKTLPIADES